MKNQLNERARVRRSAAGESGCRVGNDQGLSGVNDQFFFREELERTVTFHIHGVAVVAVRGREDRNDDAGLTVVARLFNAFANRKFRHDLFLFGNLVGDSPANRLTVLKQRPDQTSGGD